MIKPDYHFNAAFRAALGEYRIRLLKETRHSQNEGLLSSIFSFFQGLKSVTPQLKIQAIEKMDAALADHTKPVVFTRDEIKALNQGTLGNYLKKFYGCLPRQYESIAKSKTGLNVPEAHIAEARMKADTIVFRATHL